MDLKCPYCKGPIEVDDSQSELNGDPIIMIVCRSSQCGAEFSQHGDATLWTRTSKKEPQS